MDQGWKTIGALVKKDMLRGSSSFLSAIRKNSASAGWRVHFLKGNTSSDLNAFFMNSEV